MDIKEITDLLSVLSSSPSCKVSQYIGKKVIVRSYNSGVNYWILEEIGNWYCRLSNTRRLFKWVNKSGIDLNWTAEMWLIEGSKVTTLLNEKEIYENNFEILPCSEVAIESIENYPTYKE